MISILTEVTVTSKSLSLCSTLIYKMIPGYASVLTILAFSMERYLAICHPLYQYAMAGFSRAVKVGKRIPATTFALALVYKYHFEMCSFRS